MSWRSASTSTSSPSSRAVALVTGPIETTRGPSREPLGSAERLAEEAHGRGAREGDVVGLLDELPQPSLARAARARSRRARRRRPRRRLAQSASGSTSRASAARATSTRLPRDAALRQLLGQRLGDRALRDEVRHAARAPRSAPRRAGPDRGERHARQRAGVEPGRVERVEQQLGAVRARQADDVVAPVRERLDRARDVRRVDARLDPDRRRLDHLGAQRLEARGEPARLGAGARDRDAPAVQRRAARTTPARSRSAATGPDDRHGGRRRCRPPRRARRSRASGASTVRWPGCVPRSTTAAGSRRSRPCCDQPLGDQPRSVRTPM